MAGNFYVKSDFQLIYHISQSFARAARPPQDIQIRLTKVQDQLEVVSQRLAKIQTIYILTCLLLLHVYLNLFVIVACTS